MFSSIFKTPKKFFKVVLILLFILTLTSWLTSIYLSTSMQASNESIIPTPPAPPFELSKTTDFSYSTIWNKVYWIQKRQYNLNIQNSQPEQSFLQQLQSYEVSGHNTEELNKLLNQLPPQTINSNNNNNNNTITAIIHITNKQSIEKQLNSLLSQTMSLKEIWVICFADLYSTMDLYADKYRSSNLKIQIFIEKDHQKKTTTTYPTHSAGATDWLYYLSQVKTDYVWILEDGIIPSNDYLKTIYSLLQTDQYKNALLGSHASLLPSNIYNTDNGNDKDSSMASIHCLPFAFHFLPKVTQNVDMIHHTWFLRSSWIPYLLMDKRSDALSSPLSYYISQSLYIYASIPSIVIPPMDLAPPSFSSSSSSSLNTTPLLSIKKLSNVISCNSITDIYRHSTSWKRILSLRSNPTAYDHRLRTLMSPNGSPSVLFFINGLLEAKTLFPLICRFDKKIPVHVVVTGEKKGLSGDMLSTILKTSNCTSDTIIHDLDLYTVMNSLELSNHVSLTLEPIIQAIQPRLFFHLRDDAPLFNSLDTMAKIHHLTTIQLHSKDVQHALWITKLPIEALQYWNRVNINLIAITDRRPHSLSRLFNSLNHATYFDDKVDITIHMEQTADRVTKLFVNSFNWKYGLKSVRHRIRKGGLMPAIIESWYPSDNHSYGVLLEDDIEVSPLFYAWIKYNILHYRYSVKNVKGSQWIYGISLYSPRNLELLPDGRKEFDPNEVLLKSFPPRTPYASQVPCSWGAVYFPEHWREFHQYLTSRLLDLNSPSPRLKITVPKSRSSRWKKSWKKYFIEMVYLRAYVMIYPNFQDFESFSTNHLEFGTHIKHERAQMAINSFVVPLMQRDTIMDQLPHHQLPDFKELPFMDLWGNLKTHRELDQIGEEWHRHVSSCIRQPGKYNPQDLLCPLYRGNSTINNNNNNNNQLKLKSPLPINNQASMAGIAIKNDDGDYEKMKNDNVNNRDNNNKNILDTDGGEDMSISLDVAKMTTIAIDHDNEDDEMKDLEASWEVLTQLGKQLQSHF